MKLKLNSFVKVGDGLTARYGVLRKTHRRLANDATMYEIQLINIVGRNGNFLVLRDQFTLLTQAEFLKVLKQRYGESKETDR